MKTKHLIISIFITLINSLVCYVQGIENNIIINDTIADSFANDSLYKNDSLYPTVHQTNDSILYFNNEIDSPQASKSDKKKKNTQVISSKVEYNAEDSTIFSVDGQKVFLFGKAEIKYEDIELTAAYIEVDMEGGYIYAEGVEDSTGTITDQPIFVQDGQEIKSKSITYNLKTEKGYVKGLYTQQDEGYLHSSQTKMDADKSVNLNRGKYTTCELEDPHFYLWISRGKVVPDKAIVSSYAFLVVEDVPLYPLMIPFGYFPNTKEKASGFLIPKFGEEKNRGFYLRQGGYYFALSEYADLAVKGDVYSKGSWQIGATSKYKLRYKFSGNVDIGFSKIKANEPSIGSSGQIIENESNQYRVVWSHTQDPKARPNSNFNANVNFSSMNDNKYNARNSQDYLTNTTSSSISYRKNFANTPFSMSANLRHSQNTRDSIVNLTLPQVTFNMSRIFPFRRKTVVGKTRWYENIGITYTGNYENRSKNLHDTVMFTPEMMDRFSHGAKHYVPLSTSLKVLKYFNLSPGMNFTDRMYFKRDIREYDADTTTYKTKTETGFYNIYDYNASIGLGTTLYGMYQYKSRWLKAIRHVATPSVSLSYRPDFSTERFGFYVSDTNETNGYYDPYKKYSLYGMPGTGKSGSINFSLNNNIEMKVADNKDTTQATKKVKLLDALNFSSSYNIIADSMNWAPISINARATIFKGLSVNMSASANLYTLDPVTGRPIDEFEIHRSGKIARMTNMRFSTGYSFKSKDLFKKSEKGEEKGHEGHNHGPTFDGYDYFDIPWDLKIDYSYNYSKTGFTPKINQTLSFSGNFSLTPKWKIGFRSGWDFEAMDFSYTSFNLSRDLHCWMASLNVVPFGQRQSYSFSIGVKSSILQDLKYDKNESWYDNYAY